MKTQNNEVVLYGLVIRKTAINFKGDFIMKKVLSLALALIMILSIGTVGVSAASYSITLAPTLDHVRKDNMAYYPVRYDLHKSPNAYAEFCASNGVNAVSTHIELGYTYDAETLKFVDVLPSETLYNAGGTIKVKEQGTDKYGDDYFIVEIDFTGTEALSVEYFFNLQFEVLQEKFFYSGVAIARTLVSHYPVYEDIENYDIRYCFWNVTDSNGEVHDLSKNVYTSYIVMTEFMEPDYNQLLIKDYEPFIPPVEQTTLNVGTTDTIHFESDETKIFKFTPETNGDYKITVSAAEKAGLNVLVYKNGELIEKTCVTKWGEDFPFSFVDDSILTPSVEFTFEGLSAGDEIKLELIDGTHDEGLSSQMSASWMPYFTPSSVTITVENVTPVVEEEPLFEFGVTAQHIRNRFDMLYYPVSFGFSMYDDADIRYSDICADVADLAFGCDTEVVMKYIYDATTLDFVYVYDDSWNGSVEVLEHGSTGMTGDEGQEYNYIILKAKFSAVGYANGTAPYYLTFAVVEENFVNSDGTLRKVIDNVPYTDDQLCVWNAWDAKGNSFDFSDKIKFKSSDYETDGYTYDNLLLEDDLIPTDVSMPTVTFTPEHARKDDLAYYPCMYDSNVDYEEWVHSATGFKDSTTKIQIKVNYDSSTLELLDALPSKELYDLGGTVTIIETGDLYPDDHENSNLKYAVIQIEFDALDFNEGCLFSLKFRVLQENFLDEEGYPIDLVNSFVADWVVTSNAGKSHDLRYYVSSSYVGFDTFSSYEELILADYEPFDPILLTDVTGVTYVQQEDTHKTFTVTANGRKQMIQFIEPDGGTRTYDRYHKNVKITSYNSDGEVVNSMARYLAYEVWEIYSNMSVGVEIQVRGKENYKWDEFRYSFTIEPYNPIISMELSATSGKKGAVPATVIADEKTEKVMFKMPNGTSVTVASTATDENGNKIFIGNAWMNEDGLNEIEVKIYRKNVWKSVGTLEYTVE